MSEATRLGPRHECNAKLIGEFDTLRTQLHPLIHTMQLRIAHDAGTDDELARMRACVDAFSAVKRRPNARVVEYEEDVTDE